MTKKPRRILNQQGQKTVIDVLNGIITDTDAEMLKMCMEELELTEKQQVVCLTPLEELATKYYAKKISLLYSIPCIQKTSALSVNVAPPHLSVSFYLVYHATIPSLYYLLSVHFL